MKTTVKGLVLREIKQREADRILTILTPEQGVVSAYARGSLRPNSKLFSASGLFCFSEWTFYEGKNMFTMDEAAPIEVFFGLRNSIEGVSLAAYIAELLRVYSPIGEEASRLLSLALNSFYLLSEAKKAPALVKAVFELRSLAEAGYMPELNCCEGCGCEEGLMYFDPREGALFCGSCGAAKGPMAPVNPAVLAAMRHIVYAGRDKVFSFSLQGDSALLLCRLAEEYLLCHLDYPPKTLAFLKTVL